MKKKAIISIMIVFVLMITTIPAFADIPIPPIPSDAYEYWIVITNYSGNFKLFTSTHPFQVNKDRMQIVVTMRSRWYKLSDNKWEFEYERGGSNEIPFQQIYASNHNIAYDDGSGFFFTPPKVSPLYQSMKQVDFGMILRTFSAGLIPLVGLIVSGICLMKGLAYLRSQLMR